MNTLTLIIYLIDVTEALEETIGISADMVEIKI